MTWIIFVGGVLILFFGFVVAVGAPYLPTKKKQIDAALDLLGLKKGQTLLELGCGDGRVLRLAAERGIKSIGYELNPLLVIIAKLSNLKYKDRVSVRWGNYWRVDLPKTDGIYVFLLDKYMNKLDRKIINQKLYPTRLASFAFKIPGKKVNSEKDGVFLYNYKKV